ncbi:MAG: DUF4846 domain-containing protein [Bacteroidia bacterium]
MQAQDYGWLREADPAMALEHRIAPPGGYVREPAAPGSMTAWLRGLPLLPGRPEVLLYNGTPKGNQTAHYAVVQIDVGNRDLQQCADAVMRLRAEYLYACGRHADIHFDFTSGDRADYPRWRDGWRPQIQGNSVKWTKQAAYDDSYATFRRYLDVVFTYAGTWSLSRELVPVADPHDLRPGDVFIQGAFPGHAVLVVDVAVHAGTGRKVFLLAQSYMPAQQMHILRHPGRDTPWYETPATSLATPEWFFPAGSLKRWP